MITKIFFSFLFVFSVSFFVLSIEDVSALTTSNVIADCDGPNHGNCNIFNDITIDTTIVSKIEIIANHFDDSGKVTLTSPTGVVTTPFTTPAGCVQNLTTTGDVTGFFPENGPYLVHVYANNDCGWNVEGSVTFKLTYKACLGPTSPVCNTPGPCQALPGECVDVGGVEKCKYAVSTEDCNADGDNCTLDHCDTLDGGVTGVCVAGINVCGGLIPCGRMVDDPTTTNYREDDPCTLCHLILMVQLIIDFLVKISAVIAAFFLAIAGFMYIFSSGKPELLSSAKTIFKTTLIGFILIFVAWIMVDTILTMFGFIDPLGDGNWHVMC